MNSYLISIAKLTSLATSVAGIIPQTIRIFSNNRLTQSVSFPEIREAVMAGLLHMEAGFARRHTWSASKIGRIMGLNSDIQLNYEIVEQNIINIIKFIYPNNYTVQTLTGVVTQNGKVIITSIDSFNNLEKMSITNEANAMLIIGSDRIGLIADVTSVISSKLLNISKLDFIRESNGSKTLLMLGFDSQICSDILDRINSIQGVSKASLI